MKLEKVIEFSTDGAIFIIQSFIGITILFVLVGGVLYGIHWLTTNPNQIKYIIKKVLEYIGYGILLWIIFNWAAINLYCSFSNSKLCYEHAPNNTNSWYSFRVPGHDPRGVASWFFTIPYLLKEIF